jgi:two-component system sensor histidine kinase UhpB
MSLRARINLLVTGLTLLFIALGLYLMLGEIRRQIREEIEASNRVTAQLMTAVIFSSGLFSSGAMQQNVVHDFLSRLGRVRANDITLRDRLGTVVYRSPPPTYKAGRDAPAWFVGLVGPELPPVTLDASGFRIVITPDASRSVLDAWDDLVRLGALVAVFFVVINGVLAFVIGRAVRPVQSVVRGLQRVERGDLSVRLPPYALPELQAIGVGFNRMLSELERTVAVERDLAENRELTHLIQRHLEEERRGLARELHDEIGQYLTAIKTLAQATANRSEQSDPTTHEASRVIVSSAGRIYDAMHAIIRRLRPMALEGMGLADTLAEAVTEWRRLHPQLAFELHLPETLPRLGDEAEIALFRIAQEAVTNVVRHAQAQTVSIEVSMSPMHVKLDVSDDGIGIAPERLHQPGHYGLLGMRERVQGLGGALVITTPADGDGTRIAVELPLEASK